jgi:hypothetical protein
MNLDQYYKSAKEIGEELKTQDSSILNALNYDSGHDHPSQWVPKVQQSLIAFYKEHSNSEKAEQILSLYVQGEIIEDKADRNIVVKVGFICLLIGVLAGWFIWGNSV